MAIAERDVALPLYLYCQDATGARINRSGIPHGTRGRQSTANPSPLGIKALDRALTPCHPLERTPTRRASPRTGTWQELDRRIAYSR